MIDNLPPRLFCLHYNECDPKKCTALKLKKFNLVKMISQVKGNLKKAIVLNPFSREEISVEDRKTIMKDGLIVVDCSWKRLLNFKDFSQLNGRKLPPLVAANPINYGKWEKLSSVEALAAALYLTDFIEYSELILSKFTWGLEFLRLNFNEK